MAWPKADVDHLILTSSQMEVVERQLFEKGMPVEALMEKVGSSISNWILENIQLPENSVLILIGPGHNGGDGLVIARELYLSGVNVSIWVPIPIKKELTKKHLSYCSWLGVKQLQDPPDCATNSLWIDALFGLGQSKPLPENITSIFDKRETIQPGKLISIDIPSGICSDTGDLLSYSAAKSSLTLTVGFFKQGLIQDKAINYVGRLERIEIGLPDHLYKNLPQNIPLLLTSKDCISCPWPINNPEFNKYQRGRALVLAGSKKYQGAALLTLKGALASGVGSINAVLPKIISESLWQVLPEVVISGILESSEYGEALLGNYLKNNVFNNFDALLVGPGLGFLDEEWSDIADHLLGYKGLLVLDADAINRIAASKDGWKWLLNRNGPTWLTPHSREFQRLFPAFKAYSQLESAIQAAQISKTTILLKGANTVIADSGGKVWQLASTSPFAARAGMGDVLAGFACGLGAMSLGLGNKLDPELLACAALLHAEAAKLEKDGSAGTNIVYSLSKLVRSIQEEKCQKRHIFM